MVITSNATRINSATIILADNLIQWGKAHIENSQQAAESTSVSPIIAEVFTLLHPEAALKNLMLTNNTFQKVNVPVSKSIINFMILNLVNNSIKYSSDGQIEVACESTQKWLYISVKDSGIGMTDEQIERIIRPEAQTANAVEDVSASGIGLMLIREFLQQLQGDIQIDSIPYKGTTIKLSIPLNN